MVVLSILRVCLARQAAVVLVQLQVLVVQEFPDKVLQAALVIQTVLLMALAAAVAVQALWGQTALQTAALAVQELHHQLQDHL